MTFFLFLLRFCYLYASFCLYSFVFFAFSLISAVYYSSSFLFCYFFVVLFVPSAGVLLFSLTTIDCNQSSLNEGEVVRKECGADFGKLFVSFVFEKIYLSFVFSGDLWTCAVREAKEEMGGIPEGTVVGSVLTIRGKEEKEYTVFVYKVAKPFAPVLNHEHTNYRWTSLNDLGGGLELHPVVKKFVKSTAAQRLLELAAGPPVPGSVVCYATYAQPMSQPPALLHGSGVAASIRSVEDPFCSTL